MAVKIKICGLTRVRDVRLVAQCGVDYAGFVLYPKSPRYVAPDDLGELTRHLPAEILKVGVVVNAEAGLVNMLLHTGLLDIVQFHGDEAADMVENYGSNAWKAIGLRTVQDVARAVDIPAGMLLVDAISGAARGGTGKTCDWRLAADLAAQRPLMLAGGLNPENVAQAIAAVHPFGVDVSSGVETETGHKDHNRIRSFIDVVRSVTPGGRAEFSCASSEKKRITE